MANAGDTSKLLNVNNTLNDDAKFAAATGTSSSSVTSTTTTGLPSVNVNSQLKTGYYNVAGPSQNSATTPSTSTPKTKKTVALGLDTENGSDCLFMERLEARRHKLDDSAIWGDLSMDIRETPSLSASASASMDDCLELNADDGDGRLSVSKSSSSSISVKFKKSLPFACRRDGGWTWGSIKTFCFLICALITVHGALATGYTYSVLTTIEKRFTVNSFIAGFVISSYEIGSLLSVVFVSYFGTHGHIPRWVGLGGVVLCLGSFLFSLPHFVAPIYKPPNVNDSGPPVCLAQNPVAPMSILSPTLTKRQIDSQVAASKIDPDDSTFVTRYVYILIFSQVLLGAGGSPLFTLGTAYIDNHVEKDNAAIYLGE